MAVRWGIIGTGNIARLVAEDLQLLPRADLVAVGSRSQERANAFGEAFDVPRRYGSDEALVADSNVDVVHVATPHTSHAEHSIMAMEAGRAVLCEKPLAINAQDAEAMVACARRTDTFLMEAMWTRFLPVMTDVRRLLFEEEAIGDVRLIHADIGTLRTVNPEHRLFDRALGGGALLDLGVYPVALALDVLGVPDEIRSSAVIGETGVDEQCAAIFEYENGAQAVWSASLRVDAGRRCSMAGTKGRLRGQRAWWKGAPFVLTEADGATTTWARPYEGNGYQFEAAHVMRCLREDRTESPVMPLDDSLAILETTDALRKEWGLRYPGEAST